MIRDDPETKGTKILAVTGYSSEDIRKKIIDSGADDYLGKPLEFQSTLDKITSLLGVKLKGSPKN